MAKTRAQTKDAPRSNGLTIAIAAIVAIAVWLALHAEPWQSWSHDGFWKMDRALADPGPLYSGKEFDVYTTSATECIPGRCTTYWVPRFSSRSLSSTAGLQGDAMPALPPWVDPQQRSIWAPSVVKLDGHYVMYFAATSGRGPNAGQKCIGTALSSRAAGPFVPRSRGLVCAGPGYWALDPYAVSMGQRRFLLWREDDGAHVRGKIVGAELSADGLSLHGVPKRTLMVGESAWEDGSNRQTPSPGGPGRKLPPGSGTHPQGIGPIENPAMARDPDTGQWLLTWSANRWDSENYATGLAICKGPLGPCDRKSGATPWLRTSDDPSISTSAVFTGAGGLSFVTGPDKRLYAVFAAYRSGKASDATRIGWAYRLVSFAGGYQLVEF